MKDQSNRDAIGRIAIVIVVVIVIILAGAGAILFSLAPSTTQTTTTTQTSTGSSQTTSTSQSTTSSSLTNSTSTVARDTLSIDETAWSGFDLNPLAGTLAITGSNWWLYSVFQPLVTLNGSLLYQTGSIQVLPALALNWTVSSDGTVYTFNLRQNVSFSNGDAFNAYQVWGEWYADYYLVSNSSSFMNGYNLFNTSNVEFGPSTLALMTSSGTISPNAQLLSIMRNTTWPIYVTGPYQIVLRLKSPFAFLPSVLTHPMDKAPQLHKQSLVVTVLIRPLPPIAETVNTLK